jgi:hypothetical protein
MNMKKILPAVFCFFVAIPVMAQDVDLGLGGDVSGLLNIAAPRGTTNARGEARGRAAVAPVDRLVRLREMLAGANMPLTKDQETALNALLNRELPEMRRALQGRIADLQKTAPPGTASANMPSMDDLTPEIIRLNDQLLGKMASVPELKPEQQGFLNKLYKDQVKSRGGFDAIKLTLEDAGAPFSPEQISEIQPLFNGKTDRQQTLAKVLKLLTPPQRAALLAK